MRAYMLKYVSLDLRYFAARSLPRDSPDLTESFKMNGVTGSHAVVMGVTLSINKRPVY
jgi:hypothetical protein